MAKTRGRSKASRVYWREQGGERRAYGDFRDFADVGGGREALIPERGKRATRLGTSVFKVGIHLLKWLGSVGLVVASTPWSALSQQATPIETRTEQYAEELYVMKDISSQVGDSALNQLFPHKSTKEHTVPESISPDDNSNAMLMGALIGAGVAIILSVLLSESATGESGVHPLFVLGGIIIGAGIGSAYD